MKNLITAIAFLCFALISNAQVTSVNYQLKYDTADCQYDAYLIINEGTANTVSERIQFNSQFSMVVPTGNTVTIDTSYMPLLDNETYTGTEPIEWSLGTVITNPAALPGFDLVSITPNILTQTFHYNDLAAGDTVKLFSLGLDVIENCGEDIRMYENGVDPSSSEIPQGTDFSIGFTVGSQVQIYNGNSEEQHPPSPSLVSLINKCTEGIEIDLTVATSDCQGPLTYEWEGPDGYTATTEDVNINPATPANNGLYQVTITDAFGCTTVAEIDATSMPNAGPDETMCAGTTIQLSGTNPTTGTWSKGPSGPSFHVTLNPTGNGQVQVTTSTSADGPYSLIYSIPGCADTMTINVDPKPLTIIQGPNNICTFDSVQLIANIPGGTWSPNDESVATIDPVTGFATGVASGTTTFNYTTLDGCQSDPTNSLTIISSDSITLEQDTLCIGHTTLATTDGQSGTWFSDDPSIATIDNSGLITALSHGTTNVYFINNINGCTSSPGQITVTPETIAIIAGPDEICINGTTQLSPSSGGLWTSSDVAVAVVDDSGLVTGIDFGTASFTYQDTIHFCDPSTTESVSVGFVQGTANLGTDEICLGSTTQLIPSTGGSWISSDTDIAYSDNMGIIEGNNVGNAQFTFIPAQPNCEVDDEDIEISVINPPTIELTGPSTICFGTVTTVTTNGTLQQIGDNITYSDDGVITGIIPGIGKIYALNDDGCSSDTIDITVVETPEITFIGNDSLCVGGMTQLSPNVGVTYVSSNTNVITVDNNGNVTGVGVGEATVQVTDLASGCVSEDSPTIYVLPAPTVAITGDTEICIGENSLASPTIGGTWVSSDTGIATILVNGLITAVGSGPVTFTFTETATGCENTTETLIVDAPPTVSTEFATICIGGTTNLTPSTGGTWTALESDTASVNGAEVSGHITGTAGFIFNSDATGCDSDTLFVTVEPGTTVSITGDTEICIGETTQLSSNGEIGSWESSDVNIATVTNAGVVTGVGSGQAVCTFTSNATLCKSNPTDPVTVNPAPVLSIDDSSLCIGFTTFANSSALDGQWASNDTDIATINPSTGLITAVAPGGTTFVYSDGFTLCETETGILIVNQTPEVEFGSPSEICEGFTTQVNASVPGTWTSSDTDVATVDNNGLVTGQGAGTVDLIFTETLTGCASDVLQVTVLAATPVTDPADPELCIGETTTVTPSTGGVWVSSDMTVATIDNNGVITAVSNGSANFTYTSNDGGVQCASNSTDFVIVNPNPTILIDADVVCVGEMTMATTSTVGIWTSGNTSIATINATTGEISGVAPGQTTFTFVDDNTGCSSSESAIFTVAEAPEVTSGAAQICVGEETNVFPSTGGTWMSSDESIATITDGGLVTAVGAGLANFTFQSNATGCKSEPTDPVTVNGPSQCDDPCADLEPSDDSYILGTAFIDDNGNGEFDSDESPLRNVLVTITPGNFSILTDDNGKYQINIPEGEYTISAKVNEGNWVQDELFINNLTITEPCKDGLNFAFMPIVTPLPMVSLTMSNTIARCDWETRFTITVENIDDEPLEGILQFTFDDKTTLFSSDIPNIQVNGNIVSGQIGPLQPFAPVQYKVTVKMPNGSSVLPLLDFETKLLTLSGETIKEYGYSDQLRCSYDPNDKREYPDREGDDNLTLMEEDIEYTIRFQNNGNDTAFQVKIVDPLDPSIDPSTIRVMSSSHPVETCIDGPDLIFLFEDILLVDSMTNYDASQGYVTFRCNTKEGLAEMTLVHNQADIIFDSNAPIVTNQTINTLVTELCTDKSTTIEASICDGDIYNGQTEAGVYTETIELPYGCDSVITLILEVDQITYSQQNLTTCKNTTININGVTHFIEENTTIHDSIINANGCISNISTYEIEVIDNTFDENDEIKTCLGESLEIFSSLEGTWSSNDESIITIDLSGNFNIVGIGSTTLTFTDDLNGCMEDLPITVSPNPILTNTGSDQLCINDSTLLTSDNAGIWTSNNSNIVSINNEGQAVAHESGTVLLFFTDQVSGCESSTSLTVLPASDPMCIVSTTDESLVNSVRLYPNPAIESIFIETEIEWQTITILDVQGKAIQSLVQTRDAKLEVDVSSYVSGVYMMLFQDGDKTMGKRFVVR